METLEFGGTSKTATHSFRFFWALQGIEKDTEILHAVSLWIGKNEKSLNKMTVIECIKLLGEEFPAMVSVECQDKHGKCARMKK